MKKNLLILLGIVLFFYGCEDEKITRNGSISTQIKTFTYRAMNAEYLFKDQSPDLADNRFRNDAEFNSFVENGGSPEAFFERLTVSEDRFSFIFRDYEILENFFQGVSLSTGLKFNLLELTNSNNQYIVVTDVVKDSPAEQAGITRGMFFNRINGAAIDENNTNILFRNNTFSIGQAQLNADGTFTDLSFTPSLTPIELTENPIAATNVIIDSGHTIGYLQYNGFVFDFEEALNNTFGEFKNSGVTDLVLDLRYNGGGAIVTANALCGMITGQFEGQVFSRRQWNSQIQEAILQDDPSALVDEFVGSTTDNNTPLNSLGLNKVYVITSKEQTASSSELVINSLSPYIEVVVIGSPEGTVGKSEASRTFYDSPSLNRENLNPNHRYVLQPLIFRTNNANSQIVPSFGILPTPGFEAVEDETNLGVLGDPEEPLFKLAIDDIVGRNTTSAKRVKRFSHKTIGNQSMYTPNYQRMYVNSNTMKSSF